MNPEPEPQPPDAGPPAFDLGTWVENDLPDLLDSESDWSTRSRPVTALTADDSPLAAYLKVAEDEPPEGTSRQDRRAFFEAQNDARQAAIEAVEDAVETHGHVSEVMSRRRAAAVLERIMADAGKRAEEQDQGSHEVPVRGPEPPAVGRW